VEGAVEDVRPGKNAVAEAGGERVADDGEAGVGAGGERAEKSVRELQRGEEEREKCEDKGGGEVEAPACRGGFPGTDRRGQPREEGAAKEDL
jgi:hypothetical protein